jgi:hypothetical protein
LDALGKLVPYALDERTANRVHVRRKLPERVRELVERGACWNLERSEELADGDFFRCGGRVSAIALRGEIPRLAFEQRAPEVRLW